MLLQQAVFSNTVHLSPILQEIDIITTYHTHITQYYNHYQYFRFGPLETDLDKLLYAGLLGITVRRFTWKKVKTVDRQEKVTSKATEASVDLLRSSVVERWLFRVLPNWARKLSISVYTWTCHWPKNNPGWEITLGKAALYNKVQLSLKKIVVGHLLQIFPAQKVDVWVSKKGSEKSTWCPLQWPILINHIPVSGAVLRILYPWSHSSFTALRGECYYFSHLTVDEIETICPRVHMCHLFDLTIIVHCLPISKYLFQDEPSFKSDLISLKFQRDFLCQNWLLGRLNEIKQDKKM